MGGFVKVHCGEDTSPLLSKTALVSPLLFRDKFCSSFSQHPISRRAQLGVCTPHYYRGYLSANPSIDFYYNLRLKSSPADDNSLVLEMSRYDKNDLDCNGRVIGLSAISYASVPVSAPGSPSPSRTICVEDPLHPKLFYLLERGKVPYYYFNAEQSPGSGSGSGYSI